MLRTSCDRSTPTDLPVPFIRSCALAAALVLFAALAVPAALAQDPPVGGIEIEIRDPSPDDDYLTWAPAPARIRQVPGRNQGDVLVVLTNDRTGSTLDGELLFAESVEPGKTATAETLRLTLPADGAFRDFVVAGKLGRPSTRDKDAVVEVHLGAADGPLLATHAAMVRIRKDARTLTAHERDRFLEALADLHKRRDRYTWYVDIHDLAAKGKYQTPFWPDQSHRDAAFLAWHRAFLLALERELQQAYPDVALPYWRLSEESNLFTPEFMGANPVGGAAVEPTFTPSHPLLYWTMAGQPLLRYTKDRTARSELDQFTDEPTTLGRPDYRLFRRLVESNPHNNGHNWVGPWMNNCMISPRDPVFWVFHTEFDRLWAKWQWAGGRFGTDGSDPAHYFPNDAFDPDGAGCDVPDANGCAPLGHHLRDTMWPWDGSQGPGPKAKANRPPARYDQFPAAPFPGLWPEQPASPTPADVIDYLGLAADRLDMGYAYDDVPYGVRPADPAGGRRAAAPAARTAAAAGRVVADRRQPAAARATALRELGSSDVDASLDRALALLADAADGGPELDAAAVEVVATQMMFTDEGLDRHHELHAALVRALADPRRPVRVAALRALAPHRDPAAVTALVAALERPEGALFEPEEAILMLAAAGLGDQAAVVRPFLDHPDAGVRAAAVTALADDEASRVRILELLADARQPAAVRAAALALVARGVAGTLAAALDLVTSEEADPRLRARAAAALETLLRSPGAALTAADLAAVRQRLGGLDLETLERLGPAALRALRAAQELESAPPR